MFRKKKPEPAKPARKSARAPLPMIGVGFDLDGANGNMDDVSDGDLEDELMDLLEGGGVGVKKAPKRAPVAVQQPVRRSAPPPPKSRHQAAPPPGGAMHGFASGDDEGSDVNEDEVSDLEDELHGMLNDDGTESSASLGSAAPVLQDASAKAPPPGCVPLEELKIRLNAYIDAEKSAKSSGDGAKARRCGRSIKTLNSMISDVSKGKLVKEEDVPPMVSVKAATSGTPRPPAVVAAPEEKEEEEMPHTAPEPATPQSVPLRPAPVPPKRASPSPPPPPAPTIALVADREESVPTAVLVDFSSPPQPLPRSSPPATTNVPPTVAPRSGLSPSATDAAPYSTPEAEIATLKQQALAAKKAGDMAKALEFFRRAKEQEAAVAAAAADEGGSHGGTASASGDGLPTTVAQPASQAPADEQAPPDDQVALPGIPPPPKTVMEALEQRLAKFQSVKAESEEAGNSRKVRQYGRIVTQYQDAIRDHRKGKPVAFDELPSPPGFPPIPVAQPNPSAAAAAATLPVPAAAGGQLRPSPVPSPKPAPKVAPAPGAGPGARRTSAEASPAASRDASPGGASLGAVGGVVASAAAAGGPTKVAQQLALIKQKQQEYKTAALEAKRRGDIDKAREYLKISKGFDPMVESLEGGVRVDTVNIPSLPGLDEDRNDFTLLDTEERILPLNEAAFSQLEEALTRQLSVSAEFKEYYKTIGDVVSASRFENRASICQKDLTRLAKLRTIKNGTQGPRIIQETRKYFVMRCNPDLGDDDVEVKVIQGVNYNFKDVRDADTYVKVEFPSSTENPQRDTSKAVKDSVAPEYNLASRFQINRKSRATARVFTRAVKIEVWKQGGWFRGDSLYGTANAKLKPLELQCTMHDNFDLMDGKKAVGGSVEVSIRVRNPILKKEVEEMTKRWTIVDWDKVA